MYETDISNYEPSCVSPNYLVNCGTGKIINKANNRLIGITNRHSYEMVTIDKKSYYVHRIVYETYSKQPIPSHLTVDHIDSNIFNNKISNLRLLTPSDNQKESAKTRDYSHLKAGYRTKAQPVVCIEVGNESNQEKFKSYYACSKAKGINASQIRMICEFMNNCKTGISKIDNKRYRFEFDN